MEEPNQFNICLGGAIFLLVFLFITFRGWADSHRLRLLRVALGTGLVLAMVLWILPLELARLAGALGIAILGAALTAVDDRMSEGEEKASNRPPT